MWQPVERCSSQTTTHNPNPHITEVTGTYTNRKKHIPFQSIDGMLALLTIGPLKAPRLTSSRMTREPKLLQGNFLGLPTIKNIKCGRAENMLKEKSLVFDNFYRKSTIYLLKI
jgi:hypothetical protein